MGYGQSTLIVKTRAYGWRPDIPDVRDKIATLSCSIKSKVDLREKFGEIYDQGSIGSCTSNAVCSVFVFDQTRQNLPYFDPSRLFLYYNERFVSNMTEIDSGSSIRNCIKSINKTGICDEKLWPYHVEYLKTKPYSNCYSQSKYHKCIRYKRVTNTLSQLQMCLSSDKPVIFGFSVYDSFNDLTIWNPKCDEMPIPNPLKEKLLGGHAVVAVGYSNKRKAFLVRNSWGADWGMDGYFLMPYQFVTSSQCGDFWIIDSVSDDEVIVEKTCETSTSPIKNRQNDRQNDHHYDRQNDRQKTRKASKLERRAARRKAMIRTDDDDEDEIKTIKVIVEEPVFNNSQSKCLIVEN